MLLATLISPDIFVQQDSPYSGLGWPVVMQLQLVGNSMSLHSQPPIQDSSRSISTSIYQHLVIPVYVKLKSFLRMGPILEAVCFEHGTKDAVNSTSLRCYPD